MAGGGGIGFKSGGASKIFWRLESGHPKNIEKPRVGIKILFCAKIFAAAAASFVKSHYPCESQLNLHDLHNNSTPKIHESFTSRVGIEKLSGNVEWAAKTFYRAMSGPRKIFSQKVIWTRSPPCHKLCPVPKASLSIFYSQHISRHAYFCLVGGKKLSRKTSLPAYVGENGHSWVHTDIIKQFLTCLRKK